MKQSTGFYPRPTVDTAKVAAVGQAGGVLLTQTVRAVGLGVALSDALAPWRKPMAVHDPGKVITDPAVSLALGGDCLADIAVLRAQPSVYGRVASDPTVSRTITAPTRPAVEAGSADVIPSPVILGCMVTCLISVMMSYSTAAPRILQRVRENAAAAGVLEQ